MPIYLLGEDLAFPDPRFADEETGIVAVGGDLSADRLILAYSHGIFPWYDHEHTPILWHSPDPRFVLTPDTFRVGRSLGKALRRTDIEVRYDHDFEAVISLCAKVPRGDQDGTWLNDEMMEAYVELHRRGFAHSAEAYLRGRLVGGLYGVALGGVFHGESMFSLVDDASKIVFATLVPQLVDAGYGLIDCQIHTEHLARFGAENWTRDRFLNRIKTDLRRRPNPIWPSPYTP